MPGNVEVIRAAFDAWNRNDLDGWLAAVDPDIEFYPAGVFPDFERVYRGHKGVARFWRTIHEPWQELRAEIENIEETGSCLVVNLRFRATGSEGIHVDLPLVTAMRFRDGRVVEMISRLTVEEAWAALGQAPAQDR